MILLLFSCFVVSHSLWHNGLQHVIFPCCSPSPVFYSNSCLSSWWCHPTISSSAVPFSSWFQSFLVSGSFHMCQFFASGGQSIGVSASISVLPMNIQDWFPLGWTGLLSCCPKDSQESSPTPQFKSINSSVPSLLSGPTLTTVHQNWKKKKKNYSFDYMDSCWQSNISALNTLSRYLHTQSLNTLSGFSSKEQASFNFIMEVIICSNFEAQENKHSQCFHCFLIYFSWNDGTKCHDLSFLNVELFYDPVDFGNLFSGYSAFSKSSLRTWKFAINVLLKPS